MKMWIRNILCLSVVAAMAAGFPLASIAASMTANTAAAPPVSAFYKGTKSGKFIDFVGDSTTEAAAAMYDRLRQDYAGKGGPLEGAVMQNRGASGNTLHHFVNNIAPNGNTLNQVIQDQADLYIVSYGINDIRGSEAVVGSRPDQIKADLKLVVDRLLKETNGAVLLRIPNPFLSKNESKSIVLTPIENAQLYSDQLWEVYQSFEGYSERVDLLDIPNLVFGRKAMPVHPLMNDILHPNADGYRAIADAIADRITGLTVSNHEVQIQSYTQESRVDKTIAILQEEKLFDAVPLSTDTYRPAAIATLSPQMLQVVAQQGGMYRVKTWLGEKWINPIGGALEVQPSSPGDSLQLGTSTYVFHDPYSANTGNDQGFMLSPQEVKVLARWHGYPYWKNEWYYLIETVLGPKWVQTSYALPSDLHSVSEWVEVKKVTDLNKYPWNEAYKLGQITPQNVAVFEKGNGWFHIHSWAGDAWIKV